MARIEDLIKDIADPQLRDQIAREVSSLKARKKFGLVFEQHLPEVVRLPSLPIKTGVRVAKRGDEALAFFTVTAVVNRMKVIVVPERGGAEETVAKTDLVVVKRFGEPMYPALIPVDRVTRAPGKPYHTVINADNFHALQVLLYCYEGMVDVIYIDPPYNSGACNSDLLCGGTFHHDSKFLGRARTRGWNSHRKYHHSLRISHDATRIARGSERDYRWMVRTSRFGAQRNQLLVKITLLR